jgi:hypothetical protein
MSTKIAPLFVASSTSYSSLSLPIRPPTDPLRIEANLLVLLALHVLVGIVTTQSTEENDGVDANAHSGLVGLALGRGGVGGRGLGLGVAGLQERGRSVSIVDFGG